MNRNNRAAKKYLQKVRRSLTCPRKLKKRMLDGLRSDIDAYLEEHPNASLEDLTERFGEPAALSESYLSALDAGELKSAVNVKKRVVLIVLSACAAAVLIWLIAVCILLYTAPGEETVRFTETVIDHGIVSDSSIPLAQEPN